MSFTRTSRLLGFAAAIFAATGAADESVPTPSFAERLTRLSVEYHRTFGSQRAEKRQGNGVGMAVLFPLPDSAFDLGVRYYHIHEDARRKSGGQTENHTALAGVMDFYFWRSKLPGAYVGGEIGVTDPAANRFFSVYSDYVFTAKIGYERAVTRKWSAAAELRRSFRDEDPLKPTRESRLYSSSMNIGARYAF